MPLHSKHPVVLNHQKSIQRKHQTRPTNADLNASLQMVASKLHIDQVSKWRDCFKKVPLLKCDLADSRGQEIWYQPKRHAQLYTVSRKFKKLLPLISWNQIWSPKNCLSQWMIPEQWVFSWGIPLISSNFPNHFDAWITFILPNSRNPPRPGEENTKAGSCCLVLAGRSRARLSILF